MTDSDNKTAHLLELLRNGDDEARNRLIDHACERLRHLTRRMLKGYPKVRRWEETDDVFNNASMRLCRALEAKTPESPRHFYSLAAQQIRRELIDLARHHLGPEGPGTKHHTDKRGKAADDPGGVLHGQPSEAGEPETLEAWTRFHLAVEELPAPEQELVNLLWNEGLTQVDAASVLDVSLRTVKRLWLSARLKLVLALHDEVPV